MHITSSQRSVLAQKLFDKMIELRQAGEQHTKKYEIAFQDVIEAVFPEECWWNITGCEIFLHLIKYQDPEATVIEILKQLKED